jgi:hypothetical protein
MLKTMFAIAAVACLSALPAHAANSMMAMSKCDDASMMSMQGKVDAMTDAKQKKMAMSEMMMAKTDMKAHKMKSCSMHMDKAMKSMGSM